MKRVLLATLLGALTLFVWGFLSWTVLHLHDSTYRPIPHDAEVRDVLDQNISETGVYYYPPEPASMSDEAAVNQWERLHEAGPLFTVMFQKEGRPVMHPLTFVYGLISYLIICFLISLFIRQVVDQLSNYLQRVLAITGFGIAAAIASYINIGVWLYVPWGYAIMMGIDLVIGWLLAGLVISAIVRPEHRYKV